MTVNKVAGRSAFHRSTITGPVKCILSSRNSAEDTKNYITHNTLRISPTGMLNAKPRKVKPNHNTVRQGQIIIYLNTTADSEVPPLAVSPFKP